jgi:hypothetical protein
MLISCRVNGNFLKATPENAKFLVNSALHLLIKPRFAFDVIQTIMCKRYNYESQKYDLWSFINFHEGGIHSNLKIEPENGCFVLEYHDNKWQMTFDI